MPRLPFDPRRRRTCLGWLAVLAVAGLVPRDAAASDHADPADPLRVSSGDDRGLTDLFAFPTRGEARVDDPNDADGLVLILCVNRLLAKPPPYEGLDTYRFTICLDTQREVRTRYPKEPGRPGGPLERDTARYGGVVANPEQIEPTLAITMKLRNDLGDRFGDENIIERSVTVTNGDGGRRLDPAEVRKAVPKWGAGVRDDPFIFPPFFGTNVIAMAVRVPYASLPAPGRTALIWATAERHGVQFEHVGRSQRTQLPRFDFLNTLPPRGHVGALRKMREDPTLRQNLLQMLFPTEFAFRPFDDQPDVMVFTRDHPAGYPNGRRLQDDVAKLTCEQGDCQLFELSFARPRSPESERHSRYEGGRATANDKEFLETWPYLAEPWPNPDVAPPRGLTTKNTIYLAGLALFGGAFVLLPWVLYFRSKAQLRRLRVPPPAPQPRPAIPPGPGGPPP